MTCLVPTAITPTSVLLMGDNGRWGEVARALGQHARVASCCGATHPVCGMSVRLRRKCSRGVEVEVIDSAVCRELMESFIAEQPALWNEDIGI